MSDDDQTNFTGGPATVPDRRPDQQTRSPEERAARRERRRQRARAQLDNSVASPCILVCQLDPKNDLCIGCRRHVDEIRDWPILSADEKRAILASLPARAK